LASFNRSATERRRHRRHNPHRANRVSALESREPDKPPTFCLQFPALNQRKCLCRHPGRPILHSTHRIFFWSTLLGYQCFALDTGGASSPSGPSLGPFVATTPSSRAVGRLRVAHLLPGRHGAFRHRHIGFADRTVDFARPRGRFQSVRQQVALQRDAVGPHALQRGDVLDL